jgi:hypothetical protein
MYLKHGNKLIIYTLNIIIYFSVSHIIKFYNKWVCTEYVEKKSLKMYKQVILKSKTIELFKSILLSGFPCRDVRK